MKKFIKKFNNTKLSTRLVYLIVLAMFIGSYIYLLVSALRLTGIETKLRIVVLVILGILVFAYAFGALLLLLTKKKKTIYIISFFVMLISACCIIGGIAINKVLDSLSSMTESTILYTTDLITLNSTEYKETSDFTVGIIDNETDVEGNILPYELINKESLPYTIKTYSTYFEMLEDLYDGKLNGMFVTSNYSIIYSTYDAYTNIATDVKVVKTYSKEMANQDYIESTASVKDPFTILVMGVDSTSSTLNANAAFNGDTLMLISFNPHTLAATIFSIPRDTYVPIACLNGQSSKINSSAAYGTQCVINTVQNLTGVTIDYYVKMDFQGVVDLVNSVGGIDITVPDNIDFCESNQYRSTLAQDLICIKSGYQHMDGEQALAFARHRHSYATGDFQRIQNQQLIVESIAGKIKDVSSVNDFYSILDAISANMDTNMSTSNMLSLYGVAKNALTATNANQFNITKTYLTGYDLTMYVKNLRGNVYTFQYYEQSLAEIVKAMNITLEKEKPTMITTFNFSTNDTYEQTVVGKNYYTVQRNETTPNFTGQSLEYVQSWASARNIKVYYNYVNEGDAGYDDSLSEGTVVSQNIIKGTLVSSITNITVNVIHKHTETTTTTSSPTTNITSSTSKENTSTPTPTSTPTTTAAATPTTEANTAG